MNKATRQLFESTIIQNTFCIIKEGEVYTAKCDDTTVQYSWNKENGFTFKWPEIPSVKWYRFICDYFYFLYREREGEEIIRYKMYYSVDRKTCQPVLKAEFYDSFTVNDNWKTLPISYDPSDQELQLIKQISKEVK